MRVHELEACEARSQAGWLGGFPAVGTAGGEALQSPLRTHVMTPQAHRRAKEQQERAAFARRRCGLQGTGVRVDRAGDV